ncbi:unnamed protein product, partial [Ectocarpus sp. 6 AP-2014]
TASSLTGKTVSGSSVARPFPHPRSPPSPRPCAVGCVIHRVETPPIGCLSTAGYVCKWRVLIQIRLRTANRFNHSFSRNSSCTYERKYASTNGSNVDRTHPNVATDRTEFGGVCGPARLKKPFITFFDAYHPIFVWKKNGACLQIAQKVMEESRMYFLHAHQLAVMYGDNRIAALYENGDPHLTTFKRKRRNHMAPRSRGIL